MTEYDVFLASAAADRAVADAVTRQIEAAALRVFDPARDLGPNEFATDALREAVKESLSLVVLLTRTSAHSTDVALEVGAAWVWSTPVYVLFAADLPHFPPYLRQYPAYALWDHLPTLIDTIRAQAVGLTPEQRTALVEVYQSVGVPVDRLMTEPASLARLAHLFADRSGRRVPEPRLLRDLMNLRKGKRLPRVAAATPA